MRKLWIDNQQVEGPDGPRGVIDPATGQVFAEASWGDLSTAEREKADVQVQVTLSERAEVLDGGQILPKMVEGFFYEPTILTDVTDHMEIFSGETFGRMIPLAAVAAFEEAICKANQSVNGLVVTLFQSDARKVKTYLEESEAVNVWVNNPLINNVAGSFGWMKCSGLGRKFELEGQKDFYQTCGLKALDFGRGDEKLLINVCNRSDVVVKFLHSNKCSILINSNGIRAPMADRKQSSKHQQKDKKKRSTTPTFITEIPLKVNPSQEKILLKRLEAGRRVYNACLGEALQRAQALRRSPAYQAARAMPAGKPESPERKARSKAFTQARRAVGFGEYDLHAYAKQFGHSYLGDHLDSLVVQAVASRAYKAVNDYLLGKKGRPRFKGRNQFDSVEGKYNKSGLRWKDNRVVWNVLGGRRLILEPIFPVDDEVVRHGLSRPVKYVRIVRRKLNGHSRFFVQLVGKGRPYQKPENPLGQGVVGLDIGPQTVAIVSQTGASLRLFVAELERRDAEIQALQRQIERQRRANNPDNYYPDRWVQTKGGQGWKRKRGQPRPGKRAWAVSNRQQANQKRLAELHRKQAEHRKSLHGRLVNDILRMGDRIHLEKLSYQAFQKGYGRSTQFRAPGKFVAMLRRKAESASGAAREFPTHTTRLSQVCLCGAVEKKALSQRWHRCACGVVMQRDLFSAFLAMCVEDEVLNAEKAREIWPGLESVLWAALSEIESVNGAAILPASVGLQRQNGSSRKPEEINAKGQAEHRPGSGVGIEGTPRLQPRGDVRRQSMFIGRSKADRNHGGIHGTNFSNVSRR